MQQSQSMDELKLLLKESIFRQNEEGRIYGTSFIDYQNKTITNGSRLGKEFLAYVFHEKFADKNMTSTQKKEYKIESESDFIASLFSSLFEQYSR